MAQLKPESKGRGIVRFRLRKWNGIIDGKSG